MDWKLYPNFTRAELACKHTQRCLMRPDFMAKLQQLRVAYQAPMPITSGYRDPSHPVERNKTTPGPHTLGRAVDVAVAGSDAFRLVALAIKHGFTGIGVQQTGASRFIHLDDLGGSQRPMIWSYNE